MDKVKVGFVGAGWMGSVQLKRLTERDDTEVPALFEPNKERGRAALAEAGLSEDILVSDYDQIVNNADIDAVWLVSPNCYHGPQSIQAMKAGKHVFCEKPCATKFEEFCRQIELERANPELITFVDYILYFDPMENRLKQMVADGEFGTVTQIQVNYRHPVNIAGDKVWKLNKEIMGDGLGMGINHAISAIVGVMSSQAKPVGVYATSLEAKVRAFEVDPVWNILIRFDNGAAGFCFGNIDNSNGYDAYHNVFGTEGGFVFESQVERKDKVRYWSEKSTGEEWIYPLDGAKCKEQGVEGLAWPEDTATPDSGDVVEHQTGACTEHFIECVKSRTKSPLNFEGAAIIAEIGWAAQMSAAGAREIKLPLNWDDAKAFFSKG
ncbi:MAG: Gfo/Idh/MocA family protein [Planctomycetota bacterium]